MIKPYLAPSFKLALVIALSILFLSFFNNSLLTTSPFIIENREYWRWFTANLVHFGWAHSLMNLAGFLLITWALFFTVSPLRFTALFIFCALAVGIGMSSFSDISYYAGLSGVLHGLLIAGSFYALDQPYWKRTLVLLITLGKIIQEQLPGYEANELQSLLPVAIAVDAHLIGAIAGFVFFIADKILLTLFPAMKEKK